MRKVYVTNDRANEQEVGRSTTTAKPTSTPNSEPRSGSVACQAMLVLGRAVKARYGEAEVELVGGQVDHAMFYCDFDVKSPISITELAAIEATMRGLLADQDVVDAMSCGWFKLLTVGGVHRPTGARKEMLQRIQGVAFDSEEKLQAHLAELEDARARDHRKIAKDLELFMFSDDAPGMPFYLPGGLALRDAIEGFEKSLQTFDYDEVRTPLMMHERFWQQSGHVDKYRENMYFVEVDDDKHALKPMSCPGHMLIYKSQTRSYRDLPLRLAEYGICHRHELSGTLSGLTRVRSFTQDDAHIFVRPDQILSEVSGVIALLDEIYRVFGFTYRVELSTRPENALGSVELWNQAEDALRQVLDVQRMPYRVNAGDGAFYGPKIDFHIEDALKRRWQCGTIQLDFQLPERMDLVYAGEDGNLHRPVVIHRAIFGSMERFIAILLEHYGGVFPLWLAPIQVRLISVSDVHHEAVKTFAKQFKAAGIRVDTDLRQETLGYKVRDAQTKKVPFAVVIGDQEVESRMLSVRAYQADSSQAWHVDTFIDHLVRLIRSKE